MKRSLSLQREILTALSADELGGVLGAAQGYSGDAYTCPLVECLGLKSWVGHCPTLPECPA